MAAYHFKSEQYFCKDFVESVGAVIFRLSTQQICILHLLDKDEYVLAKGRRNCGESRRDTAVREIMEESGLSCRLLPVDMASRCPPVTETNDIKDEARMCSKVCEPFVLQLRHLGEGDLKLIWWYIAAVDEDESVRRDLQEKESFAVEFCNYEDVLEKLSFQLDRDMVKRAIDIVNKTHRG